MENIAVCNVFKRNAAQNADICSVYTSYKNAGKKDDETHYK